ncbi:hypothetical protein ICN18_06995 [Polynucleobacter sp. Ross1-W9]|uniref:hypothetical protein n=1 Tax=Polynucleobacter parvulilacunae TaxID=1855631 RepID=UPI001C0B8854|nr:hypothetical protein [Polynucleobacter parvulilacunae]MBU3557372.1 hypothetical protein [Polynucleobacter parvulilacunae]
MTNHSNAEPDNKEGLQDTEKEAPSDREIESKWDSGYPRRPGHSKREIMEDLSRARFPWDE